MCMNKERVNDKKDEYIIVGEQRDLNEYINAANTGHLVFTTPQPNMVEIFKRLKELGIQE